MESNLKIFQTMACLEVLHSMLGLVKSPWFTTFMQGILYSLRATIFAASRPMNLEESQ